MNKTTYRVEYTVSGLEQIAPTNHANKAEARLICQRFIRSLNGIKSKRAGEKVEKLPNGYALRHIAGGTVAIATIN